MKVEVIQNVQLRIEAPKYIHGIDNDERALKDLIEAIQNHKDLSGYYMWIEHEKEFQCSFCHREWEKENGGAPVCCEKAIAEYDSKKKE